VFRSGARLGLKIGRPKKSAGPKKRCAAQAEYGRLAAQAYSPSEQCPRQKFVGMECKRFNAGRRKFPWSKSGAETRPCGRRIWCEGGVVLQISPSSATSLHAPCGGSFGLGVPIVGAGSLSCRSTPDAMDEAAAAGCELSPAFPAGPAPAP